MSCFVIIASGIIYNVFYRVPKEVVAKESGNIQAALAEQ
jgi:hypothetical protein